LCPLCKEEDVLGPFDQLCCSWEGREVEEGVVRTMPGRPPLLSSLASPMP
jgi:hypothetical protein